MQSHIFCRYRQTEQDQESPSRWFIKELKRIGEEYGELYNNPMKIQLTATDWQAFGTAKECWICGEAFGKGKSRVVA